MEREHIGVLVMSYGTPESMDHIEQYYTHIRRGHAPSVEQLAELTERYEAIVGGVFPLRQHTNDQVTTLEATLNQAHPDKRFSCYQGLKHASPYIEDGVEQMVKAGVSRGVGIVLAPHYSTMSVGAYIKRAQEKADELGLAMTFVESYHLHPKLVQALTERVRTSLLGFDGEPVRVLFSAHSLPEKIVEMGDPYPTQLLETSRAVAEAAGVADWQFAWQSAGRTSVPWLGPDILDVVQTIKQEESIRNVLVCPLGFVSDHLEVLYDLDIEAKEVAAELGMKLTRTASLNSDPLYMQTLSDAVYAKLSE
ncbi:ferrochelatase [Paenibacillus sp. N1-5-1-14]|uniref:ferrochelatase n=1 Tax=Paenibacillus radicibacter TaxID=2972488 RepID=UPI002158CC05|nr:ferrochelatase [Paenibacillus radicibacter]MCR8644172.1 ferrochelatase [Paenibacillus radicibacter]